MKYRIRLEAQDTTGTTVYVEGWDEVLVYLLGLIPPVTPFAVQIHEYDEAGQRNLASRITPVPEANP